MPHVMQPDKARQFARRVVCQLRAAGYEACWAGGCVRDQLLGLEPHDYDVATSAKPDEIRACFSRGRTLPLGAAFGVITVLGRRGEGQIEVATFRQDTGYSDGRHPDGVVFSTAQLDAQRRDFTINGLFFDPIMETVIDYVGGREDLQAGIVRAIGDPTERIGEDRLRMLRAARFAATYDFQIDPATQRAVVANADRIAEVSAERIAGELRRMLVHSRRARAVRLLQEMALLPVILPESRAVLEPDIQPGSAESFDPRRPWHNTLVLLQQLDQPTFPVALAALLRAIYRQAADPAATVVEIGRRWRLSNSELQRTAWLLATESMIRHAVVWPWPEIQRLLVTPGIDELMLLAEAVVRVEERPASGIAFCREKLQLPATELNPPPLVNGDDLRRAGLQPGPAFHVILTDFRDRQLLGQLQSRQAAIAEVMAMVDRLADRIDPH